MSATLGRQQLYLVAQQLAHRDTTAPGLRRVALKSLGDLLPALYGGAGESMEYLLYRGRGSHETMLMELNRQQGYFLFLDDYEEFRSALTCVLQQMLPVSFEK